MSIAYLKKIPGGFVPDAASNDSAVLDKIQSGEVIKVSFTRPRNYERHKKYFALLNLAYDAFEPQTEHRGQQVQKNFERFRKDIAVMAGHYDVVSNIKGEVRCEPKSISFSSMSQEEFEDLYNKSVNVVLQHVLTNYTRNDLDEVVEQVVRF